MKIIKLTTTVELEVSDKLLSEIKNKAKLRQFVINNAFRNNSRTVLDASYELHTKKFAGQNVVIGYYRKRWCVVRADKGDNYRHLWANEFFNTVDGAMDLCKANGMKIISYTIVLPSKEKTPDGRPLFTLPNI